MTTPIDIRADHLRIVHDVLARRLPDGVRVWVFGSRATWATKDSSDLDLALEGDGEIPARSLSELESAFEDSDLPYAVDVVDVKRIAARFRELVTQQRVPLPENASSHPTDWPIMSLREAGISLIDCEHRTPPASDDGYPYVGIPQIKDGRVDLGGARRIAQEHFREWIRKANPQPFDVVLSRRCNPGETAFVSARSFEFALGQNLVLLRADGERILKPFLRWLVRSPEWWNQIAKYLNVGAVFDSLKCVDIPEFLLPIPPLPDQRVIARILGALDDKIELNRRMNATLEEMARALFRSWFVDFDPVRAKMEGRDTGLPKEVADLFPDRLVNSELGEIPEGWQLKPLDAVARFRNGLALQNFRPSPNAARLPVVKIAQLRSGEANSGEWASATITPECIIEDGDVVFSWSGSLLVRTWCGGRAALNQHLFKVTSEEYPKWYYLNSILSHFPEFERIAADKATTMGHIRRHHLSDALCIVPPDRVIARVTGTLGGLVERQVANDVASRTLTALRDALLPKLVSGELRVGDAEELVGTVA